jgi:hypothetical protein
LTCSLSILVDAFWHHVGQLCRFKIITGLGTDYFYFNNPWTLLSITLRRYLDTCAPGSYWFEWNRRNGQRAVAPKVLVYLTISFIAAGGA